MKLSTEESTRKIAFQTMYRHSLTIGMGTVAMTVGVNPSEVSGFGWPSQPVLQIPLHLDVRLPFKEPDRGFEVREVHCRVSPFDKTYFAIARPARVGVLLFAEHHEEKDHHLYLEIPLDRERLAFLERESKGKDVSLRLDIEILTSELIKLGPVKASYPRWAWGLVERHVAQGQIPVVIPRATWIERVLPQTGFGKIHVIELPVVPIERCAGMKKSFDALSEALELQKKGFGDLAVGQCRIALEPFFKQVEKTGTDGKTRMVPILEPSWETKLGEATYHWLNECFLGLKRPTNLPHHKTGTLFDQLEIQLLITVTTALIAYAANTASEAETPAS